VLRSSGVGFQHANSTEALGTLVAPYFEALDRIWKERSYKIAEYVILGFYPAPLASQELVDATNAWLDAHPDIPAMRRLVIENLAGVERALRAQQRDRSS
jgi:aminopeptidase N